MQNLSTINMARPIYLDYNSTSPVHPDVLKEMLPTFTETYGNPSSENLLERQDGQGRSNYNQGKLALPCL